MPRPRFARLALSQQRRILEHAGEEFAAHGYQHASLNHIIDALGLNKGVFYYYFDSKADLFGAVAQMAWREMMPVEDFSIETLDRESFWPRLDVLLRENHERLREQPWLAGMLRQLLDPRAPAGLDPAMARLFATVHGWVGALMRRGQEVGAVRRDLPIDLLLSVITAADQAADRWLLEKWDDLTPEQRRRLGRGVFELWRRIASPEASAEEAR